MSISEGKRKHLVALADSRGVIAAAAMDQRGSLQKSIASAKGISPKEVTQEMMEEFKIAVSKILTPHASAILLDPEFGLPAAAVRSKNAGLLLAYEETGYDNTQPGRLPDLLPHLSAKRIKDMGADAVKILIYYSPFEDPTLNDIKHAFVERIGSECDTCSDAQSGQRRPQVPPARHATFAGKSSTVDQQLPINGLGRLDFRYGKSLHIGVGFHQ